MQGLELGLSFFLRSQWPWRVLPAQPAAGTVAGPEPCLATGAGEEGHPHSLCGHRLGALQTLIFLSGGVTGFLEAGQSHPCCVAHNGPK